jgi:hypothetical protein
MKKKIPPKLDIVEPEQQSEIKFCTNCDDMDNLAVSTEADDIEKIKDRFRNCEQVGRFDGDICSRLFVAEPGDEPGPLFDEE